MKYTVNWTLKHDGKRYEQGDPIDLTEEQAAAIGGCVTAAEEPVPVEPTAPEPEPEASSVQEPEAAPATTEEPAPEPEPQPATEATKASSKKVK
jgi:hypothetical protein